MADKRRKGRKPYKKDEYKDRNRRGASKSGERTEPDNKTGGNDASWWTKSGPLSADAAKLNWNHAVGRPFTIGVANRAGEPTHLDDSMVNGIMTIDLAIEPGYDRSMAMAMSGINRAMNDIYSFLRSTNSGAKNYEPVELGVYITALDSIFSMYAWGARAYGTVGLVSSLNYYYPDGLLAAQGFDPYSFKDNLANYRTRFNRIAQMMSRFKVPKGLSIIERHFMLFSNMYLDNADVIKSQVYMYRPENFWEYSDVAGIGLQPVWVDEIDTGSKTFVRFERYLSKLEEMVRRFTLMEHNALINGDIIKAFGSDVTYSLPMIADLYVTVPVYNEEVLYQMRNATLVGEPKRDTWNITQDGGILVFDPVFTAKSEGNVPSENALFAHGPQLISAPRAVVTAEETMVYTRLMVSLDKFGNETNVGEIKPSSLSCDVAIRGRVWNLEADEGVPGQKVFHYGMVMSHVYSYQVLSSMSNFKHHPLVILTSDAINPYVYGEFFEYDNYAIITPEQIDEYNSIAVNSIYAIPEIGAWSNSRT